MGLPEAKADRGLELYFPPSHAVWTVYREAARHATILTAVEWQSWQFQVISD